MKTFKQPSSLKKSAQAGNIFFMLFASVALVGAIGVGASNHLKGIVTSMSEVTRKTVAEEKMTGGARLSIQAATSAQPNEGDCDLDGMVEPLPYRDAGASPKPTGGGYIPLNIGAEPLDPWGTPYGYCVWDAGSVFDNAGCGGPGARRLRGSPTTTHSVVAIISAGKDRRFTTSCNAYVDTTPADGNPDTPLIGRATGGDDVILEYTYNDASGMSGDDLWKVRDTTPDTAVIDKNIEVTGSGQFSGPINLMQAGLVLPADPGNNSITGPCDATTDQQLRVNIGTSPPSFEICHDNQWRAVALGGNQEYSEPTEVEKLLAVDGAAGDEFGRRLRIDGNTAVITSWEDDDAGVASGSAYVFTKSAGIWLQTQKLVASDAAAGDKFGMTADIQNDTIVIGSYLDDDAGSGSGSAYVFTKSGSTWMQTQKLVASDAAIGDNFGETIEIDGNTMIVGASSDDDGGVQSGSAYVFTKSGGAWTQTQKLVASDAAADDRFARYKIALSGNVAVIGSHQNDDGGANSGSAYVFTKSGSTWTQTQKLVASDPSAGQEFGRDVAVNGDTVIIGARYNGGAAYVFTKNAGTWVQTQKLTASGGSGAVSFGHAVDLYGDIALISDNENSGSGPAAGAVYVFKKTAGTWAQTEILRASDAQNNHDFGLDANISGDIAIIGARSDDDNGTDAGAAYVFEGMNASELNEGDGGGAAQSLKGLMKSPDFLECSAAGKGPLVKVSESDNADYRHLTMNKNYLYAASPASGLSAFSKNDGVLSRITTQFVGVQYNNLWANGSHIFAATGATGITAYTFDGTTFTAAGTFNTPGTAFDVWGDGKYIYVPDGNSGIIALTYNGASFTQVATFDTPGTASDVWGDGSFLYLSDGTGGLRILTFDGTSFSEVEIAQTGDDIIRSWADGNFIYVVTAGVSNYKRFTFDGENLIQYLPIPLEGNLYAIWGDGSNIFTGNHLGLLTAGRPSGDSLSITSNYKISTAHIRNIIGDGRYVYASQAGPIFSFSGYSCGTSMEPDPAVIIAANKYRGKISISTHSCGIKSDNTAWCWGGDGFGKLGNGSLVTGDQVSPSVVNSQSTTNNFGQISVGTNHSCALRNDGTAWCWGYDVNGELGNGAVLTANQVGPSQVEAGVNDRWTHISAGHSHTCGIKTDGTAWCWGSGVNGRLGNGATATSVSPSAVSDPGPWVFLKGGYSSTCGIKTDGSAWCWGLNTSGELGSGDLVSSSVPVPVAEPGPWSYIGRTSTTTCGIKQDGSAWCWGSGQDGRRADGMINSSDFQLVPKRIVDGDPWLEIDADFSNGTVCGIKMDGSAWCWGYNGSAGEGRRGDGTIVADRVAYPSRVTDPGPWATMSLGGDGACGIKIDGSAWCWGTDLLGRLGNGPAITASQPTPSRVYNFPNASPWVWDSTQATMTKAVTSAQVIIPSTSSIGYDDASGGLSFTGTGQTVLRTPDGNAELMVDTTATNSSAQISFDAQALANARSIGVDNVTFNLEFAVNNATASTWMNALSPQMTITPDGNVAMGGAIASGVKLTLLGSGLKVGSETRVCAPSRQGSLRYVGGVTGFEYCNGTAWVAF